MKHRETGPAPSEQPEEALAMLRDGTILGSDRWGGVFSGVYSFDPATSLSTVHVQMDVPPDGRLVTGFEAGALGASLHITGTFDGIAPAPEVRAVVDVGGQQVELRMTYLSPLPG